MARTSCSASLKEPSMNSERLTTYWEVCVAPGAVQLSHQPSSELFSTAVGVLDAASSNEGLTQDGRSDPCPLLYLFPPSQPLRTSLGNLAPFRRAGSRDMIHPWLRYRIRSALRHLCLQHLTLWAAPFELNGSGNASPVASQLHSFCLMSWATSAIRQDHNSSSRQSLLIL